VLNLDRAAFDEMISTQDSHWWFKGKRKITEKIIKSLKLPNDARILEIGCGTGGNIQMLSRYGHVWALEKDKYALDYARKENGNAVIDIGWLPDGLASVSGCKFDLICMFDVLEHIKEDEESLRKIKGFFDVNSKVLITVPAYQWLFSRHDQNLGHFRRYSRENLSEKLTRNGYRILYSGYMNMTALPLMIIARLFDRYARHSKISSGAKTPPRIANGILYYMFSSEAIWPPRFSLPFGGSVVALADIA
jgi:SAM-dependent methyltransferase